MYRYHIKKDDYVMVLQVFMEEMQQEKPIESVLKSCREYISTHPIPLELQSIPTGATWGNA